MKIGKKLRTAVALSLVMGGVNLFGYGVANADEYYYGTSAEYDQHISGFDCATGTGITTGSAENARADGNEFIVTGGTAGWNVYAGSVKEFEVDGEWFYVPGSSENNKVTIAQGSTVNSVYGGYAFSGSANGNKIFINENAKVNSDINGGYVSSFTGTSTANDNYVEVSGSAGSIYGGRDSMDAKNNTVFITETGKATYVYGASCSGEASGNTVIIAGTIKGTVVGGQGGNKGTAFKNTVTLGTENGGTANIAGNVSISYCKGNYGSSDAGDILNVYGSGHKIKNDAFGYGGNLYATNAALNFNIKAEDLHAGGKIMLDVVGEAHITDSTINAGVTNVGEVGVGDKITLLSAGTLYADSTLATGKISDEILDVGLEITKDGNSIIATATKAAAGGGSSSGASANPNAKSPVETMAAAISLLNAGSDMLANSSIMSAEQAVQAAKGDDSSMAILANIAASNNRIKSGSHVDMKSWNANLGLAKEIANKNGKFLFAPVIEYGRGNYDSYLDNGVHGEGDSHFFGGGLLAKQTFNNDWYVDGSVRGGRMKADYKTADIGTGASYDNSATYYAAHIGAGKVVKMTEKSSMDYYGKLFYSHQNSSTANLSTGHTYEFDAVDSFRTLVGLRYSQKAGKGATFYTGLAWQHEFDGECNATIRTGAWSAEAPAPSIKGDTGILELGYKFAPGNSDKFDVDLGAAGYVGKQRGGSLKLNMNFKF